MPDYGREKFIKTHNRSSIKEFSDAIMAMTEYSHMSLREMERFMLLMDMFYIVTNF